MKNQSYSSDYPERYVNTYEPTTRPNDNSCSISFTKRGFRQFARVNQLLGKAFIRAFVLYREMAAYITAHEADGYHLDTICLDVRYDENVYLLLMKCHGEWLITDIGLIDGAAGRNGKAGPSPCPRLAAHHTRLARHPSADYLRLEAREHTPCYHFQP